jgi:hypothetical protein
MKYRTKPDIVYIKNVGYVKTFYYGDEESGWRSWVVARSEKHAKRLIAALGWHGRIAYAAGQFYRNTYYDSTAKRLVSHAGWDV